MLDKDSIKEEKLVSVDEVLEDANVNLKEDSIKEANKEEKSLEGKKRNNFFVKLLAGVIDQIIVIAMALLGIVTLDLVLRMIGFYIVEREPVFLIVYVVMNILYVAICESLKMRKTIGKKILFK